MPDEFPIRNTKAMPVLGDFSARTATTLMMTIAKGINK
jgi:hypothetical protein